MGWYGEHIVPRLIDIGCGLPVTGPLRRRVCGGLAGEVLEIGFGSGLNVAHYPSGVARVTAVEPSDVAWRLARPRLAGTPPVERSATDAQSLPFADASFDACLSTWTLCSIPDVDTAISEIRRVLRPGGSFHFLEHGLAPDPSVQAWQHRLEPLQRRLFGGCHLARPIDQLVAAQLELVRLDRFYMADSPRVEGATYLGVATAPGTATSSA